MIMAEKVRLRIIFEDRHILSKSRKKEGLKRSWVLLKPHHKTISDFSSHLIRTFRLHRTCPKGIVLSMDGFVFPPFESTSILKDEDIVCVGKKENVLGDNGGAMLKPKPNSSELVLKSVNNVDEGLEFPELLASEEFKAENGGYESESEDDDDECLGDVLHMEKTPVKDAVSKKRKASKKLRGSKKKKKHKLSTAEESQRIPEVSNEEKGSLHNSSVNPQLSIVKKDKSSTRSGRLENLSTFEVNDQSNKFSASSPNSAGCSHSQGNGKGNIDISIAPNETKKLPSRSARRKKAKRQWLREQIKREKEKQQQGKILDDKQESPNQDNCKASEHQEQDEDSDVDAELIPVEIRPGHIRFEPLGKDEASQQIQVPKETFQWNGITSKKKGQKWGKEKTPSFKRNDHRISDQVSSEVQTTEEETRANDSLDFDKLIPFTSLPKEGDVIGYRLIELTESWTPEISSFRAGKVSWFNPGSNRIKLVSIPQYPFEFRKNSEDGESSMLPVTSLYGEDDSLEVDYSSLVDVRLVKGANPETVKSVAVGEALVDSTRDSGRINGVPTETATSSKHQNKEEVHAPIQENGQVNVWDEIDQALSAKKAQLSKENGWTKEGDSGSCSWSHRTLRGSALGPTMALLRAQSGL